MSTDPAQVKAHMPPKMKVKQRSRTPIVPNFSEDRGPTAWQYEYYKSDKLVTERSCDKVKHDLDDQISLAEKMNGTNI